MYPRLKKTPGLTRISERVGWRSMADKNRRVLQKLQSHTEDILRYCQDCCSLAEFEADSMWVEATVFNLMQIGDCGSCGMLYQKMFPSSARSWLLSITKGRARFHPSDPQPDPRQQMSGWTQWREQHRTASQIRPNRSIRIQKQGVDPHPQSS